MAREPKMKIGIGADTGDFEKGARRVKQEMKDLSKVSSDAFAAFGNAIGVDTGKLGQFASAISGLGQKFTQMGSEGAKSFGAILTSIGPVAAGIAGLGIAGATAAFKLLNSEAQAFKESVNGINIEMATTAYLETYRDTLHDLNAQTGKSVAQTQADWKKFWGEIRATVSDFFSSGTFFNPVGNAQQWGQNLAKAESNAIAAASIANDLADLQKQRIDNISELAKLNREISEAEYKMREAITNKDAQTASEQLAIARQKINDRAEFQIKLETQIAQKLREQANLTSEDNTRLESIQKAEEAEARVEELKATQFNQQAGLERQQRTINALVAAEAKDREKARQEMEAQAAAAKAIADSRASLKEWSAAAGANTPGAITTQATVQVPTALAVPNNVEEWRWDVVASIGDIHVGIKFDADTAKVQDITREVKSAMQGLATSVGEVLGQLAGDLATGGDAWGNFSNAALSAFGDMATAIGNIAIQTGIASLGIEAALKELGGAGAALAISAGVALVALGAAVKAGLSNVAAGNYSAGAGVATASYSSYNSDYETREVNVNVTGTLQADGNQLVAVINNTNKNNYYTT